VSIQEIPTLEAKEKGGGKGTLRKLTHNSIRSKEKGVTAIVTLTKTGVL